MDDLINIGLRPLGKTISASDELTTVGVLESTSGNRRLYQTMKIRKGSLIVERTRLSTLEFVEYNLPIIFNYSDKEALSPNQCSKMIVRFPMKFSHCEVKHIPNLKVRLINDPKYDHLSLDSYNSKYLIFVLTSSTDSSIKPNTRYISFPPDSECKLAVTVREDDKRVIRN